MIKMYIKCFLVVSVSQIVAEKIILTADQTLQIHGILIQRGAECMTRYPLELNQIQMLRNRRVLNNDELSKCFIACMFKKLGIMESQGKLSESGAKFIVREVFKKGDKALEILDEVLSKCIKEDDVPTSDGDKMCKRAALAFNCLGKHAPRFGLKWNLVGQQIS